jgi:FkbM family methyltransferase
MPYGRHIQESGKTKTIRRNKRLTLCSDPGSEHKGIKEEKMSRLRFILRGLRYRLDYDPGEIKYMLKFIRKNDTVIDIGAHFGGYTYWMIKAVGKNGKVYVFEPQPYLAGYIKDYTEKSGLKNVSIEQKGLSSAQGEMEIVIAEKGQQYSQNATFEEIPGSDFASYKVNVTTLDSYFKDKMQHPVSFIKCDAEGHELEVFKGAGKILTEHRPALLFECENRHLKKHSMNDVFGYLVNLGYSGRFIYKNKLLPISEFNLQEHQVPGRKKNANNFLFVHKDRKAAF